MQQELFKAGVNNKHAYTDNSHYVGTPILNSKPKVDALVSISDPISTPLLGPVATLFLAGLVALVLVRHLLPNR